MPVSSQHPDYSKSLSKWQMTRDAISGSLAVKAKKSEYLPVPDSETDGLNMGENTVRYRQYLKRAVFTNFVGRTKNALVGAAFRKNPSYDIPTELEYLIDDATGDGLTLVQLAKDVLSDVLATGRGLFVVDYPAAPEDLTIESQAALDLKAHIIPYKAEQVINWRTSNINGRNQLSLIVVEEYYNNSDDEFDYDPEVQQRVYRLRDEGYSVQIYRDEEPYSDEVFPTKADGSRWDIIPAIFVGSQNNDPSVDEAPLSDIAEVNIAHYRNSADLEESCFITGQGTLFVTTSLSADQWLELNPNGIKLGSRSGHVLGESGNATLLQPNANNIVAEVMREKKAEMVAIGARIITDRGQNETAEGARIRFASENSVLGDIAQNLSEALETAIYWCGLYMGVDYDVEFEINREFYDKNVDPQMIMAMTTLLDRSIITERDVFDRVKSAGLIDEERTYDDVVEEVGDVNPMLEMPMQNDMEAMQIVDEQQ